MDGDDHLAKLTLKYLYIVRWGGGGSLGDWHELMLKQIVNRRSDKF